MFDLTPPPQQHIPARPANGLDPLALLRFENVHDPEREEAATFATLDPADPRVEEVCLLLDRLAAALEGCGAAVDRNRVDLVRKVAS